MIEQVALDNQQSNLHQQSVRLDIEMIIMSSIIRRELFLRELHITYIQLRLHGNANTIRSTH